MEILSNSATFRTNYTRNDLSNAVAKVLCTFVSCRSKLKIKYILGYLCMESQGSQKDRHNRFVINTLDWKIHSLVGNTFTSFTTFFDYS